MKWEKAMARVNINNGEKTITYIAAGCSAKIESRKKYIPHSARAGGWFHTTYFVVYPDGTEKEFWRMSEAKEAAENARPN